jgi:hypothetical protein
MFAQKENNFIVEMPLQALLSVVIISGKHFKISEHQINL